MLHAARVLQIFASGLCEDSIWHNLREREKAEKGRNNLIDSHWFTIGGWVHRVQHLHTGMHMLLYVSLGIWIASNLTMSLYLSAFVLDRGFQAALRPRTPERREVRVVWIHVYICMAIVCERTLLFWTNHMQIHKGQLQALAKPHCTVLPQWTVLLVMAYCILYSNDRTSVQSLFSQPFWIATKHHIALYNDLRKRVKFPFKFGIDFK